MFKLRRIYQLNVERIRVVSSSKKKEVLAIQLCEYTPSPEPPPRGPPDDDYGFCFEET